MSSDTYTLPGEHVYDGVLLSDMNPAAALDKIKTIKDYSGDVLLATYPKTGTTWSEEMLWILKNNADLEKAKSKHIRERVPHMELSLHAEAGPYEVDKVASLPRPRIMKTHLPATFYQSAIDDPTTKIVVVARNPKDTLVSFYHFYRMNIGLGNFPGTWDEFFKLFEAKHMYHGDFFDYYVGWLEHKNKPNVYFMTFEAMKKDLKKEVLSVAKFLGTEYPEETIDKIVNHLQFKNMKANPMTNYESIPLLKHDVSPFMRKGVVGDWKNYFSAEQSGLVDQRCKELEKHGMVLECE